MIVDPTTRRRLAPIGALVAPILVVQVARVMLGAGPAMAPAATDPLSAAGPAGAMAALTDPILKPAERAREAQRWCGSLRYDGVVTSPLDHPVAIGDEPVAHTDPTHGPSIPGLREIPEMSLTGVVAGSNGAVAFMEGRVLRVGDTVQEGWVVESIDARIREVVFVSDDGQRSVYTPELPR